MGVDFVKHGEDPISSYCKHPTRLSLSRSVVILDTGGGAGIITCTGTRPMPADGSEVRTVSQGKSKALLAPGEQKDWAIGYTFIVKDVEIRYNPTLSQCGELLKRGGKYSRSSRNLGDR